jgi:probable F420-dependent oxidoreductase
MRFGLSMFLTDETIAPVELGRAAEDAGFDALFVPEHTHIPASRESPWSGGAELPRQYWHTLDPFVALSAIAATTQRLRLGTGIALIVERDPILLAKEAATLDVVSGGRFELGIGAGWNFEEMRNHGTDPDARFRVMRERAMAIRAIWTEEEASFHGEHVDFDRIWSWPKPVQVPHPPMWIGGTGPRVFDRVLEYGDGWFPNMRDLDELAPRMAELQRRAADAGRGRVPVTYFGLRDPDEEKVAKLAAAGVDRVLLMVPPAGADETRRCLERYAALGSRYAALASCSE